MLEHTMCRSLLIGIALFLLTTVGKVYGATYYVAKTGNDSNACSQATSQSTPKLTIGSGVSCLRAGDTLSVKAGAYAEEFYGAIPSGTSWSTPVTIAAFPGDTVVIQPPVGANRVFTFVEPQQYIVIQGFILDATHTTYDAVKVDKGAHHIRIALCEVKNAGGNGILVDPPGNNEFLKLDVHDNATGGSAGHGFYITSANNLVDGCHVHDNLRYGIHVFAQAGIGVDNNIVRNNRVYHNNTATDNAAGIILSSGSGNRAYNNVIWNNKFGVQIDYGAINTEVYNNTIYNNQSSNGYAVYNGSASSGAIIRNNICYKNSMDVTSVGTGATISNNTANITDPLFVDAARADFHLQAVSIAIDAGFTISLVSTDADGVPRPKGTSYDIGAYEWVGAQSPPPINLRATIK